MRRGTGLTPQSAAKLASDRNRSGLSPAVSSNCAAPIWPIQLRATRFDHRIEIGNLIVQFEVPAGQRFEADPISGLHTSDCRSRSETFRRPKPKRATMRYSMSPLSRHDSNKMSFGKPGRFRASCAGLQDHRRLPPGQRPRNSGDVSAARLLRRGDCGDRRQPVQSCEHARQEPRIVAVGSGKTRRRRTRREVTNWILQDLDQARS
jgi:hypothetical protein